MPRILLFGASGQLGIEVSRAQLPPGWEIAQLNRDAIDLEDTESISATIEALNPDAIVNAAAYTAVDKAETEIDLALALNRDAPAAMARTAARLGAPLIHISTDYVFAGDKPAPYVESDPRNPVNAYGRSKAEGEIAVLDLWDRAAIVRTSWVFSAHRANFLKTMLRLGETRGDIGVVCDQLGRPTHAGDLARGCLALAVRLLDGDAAAAGVFHFAGAGESTWADFADAIFTEAQSYGRAPVHVRRILTADYPTPAARPANSRLDTTKIEALGIAPESWRDGVRAAVRELLT
ncbi:MAG: dTDP-4-dehydrorhamnose reductase [Hyphomonadaceae bacterium]